MKALAGALGAYSLEVAILLSVLSAVYLLAVRPVRAPWVHRACIVGIYAVSLLAPLWVWLASGLWTVGEASAAGGIEVGLPVMVADGGGKAASVGWSGILAGVLAAGMAVTLLLSLAGWWRVAAGILRGRRLRVEGWTLSLVADPKAPAYSWGRWIVCSEADFRQYGRMLVVHETATCGVSIGSTFSWLRGSRWSTGTIPPRGCSSNASATPTSSRPTRRCSAAAWRRGNM